MKKLLLLIAFTLISCTETLTETSNGDYQCAGYVFKCSLVFHNDCKGTPYDRPECWKQCTKKVKKQGDYCKPTGHRWQCK